MSGLVVDSRETNSGIPAMLRRSGVEFVTEELAAGDYRIGNILIERKTGVDLFQSIYDGRLFPQAELLCQHAERPFLLLEGDIRAANTNMVEDALPGAVSALSIFWGVQVLWMPDSASTASLLRCMVRHSTEGLGYEVPLRVKKPKLSAAPDGALPQFLVEGLPGVGAETARALLRHFGSAKAVFAAAPEDLRKCAGVGPKTASAIDAALRHQPTAFRSTRAAPDR
ncbi:endonuclease [Caenimonas koreensis DSM 17982]|uniref:Endonuclease n=1 Tax=Caenimonas koreensis DSM 17982 TaxID=1121255 RepID=A0A844B972_9BURK|nr:ERCC4 domain-containing protein [Caenimonas koreensis]MRD49693.1 endonuclease [Caenimonas koreensis DSM 17982]